MKMNELYMQLQLFLNYLCLLTCEICKAVSYRNVDYFFGASEWQIDNNR